MNDIIYIKSLLQNNKDISSKIENYKNDNFLLVKNYNNISQRINSNINSIYNIINNKFNNLTSDLNYLFSVLAECDCFSNIILKIKETNNYYENKILINKNLLEKNDKIVKYIEQLFEYCNYRDIINLINQNFLDEISIDNQKAAFEFTDIDNNSVNDKNLHNNFANDIDKIFHDDNKILEEENIIDNEKLLDDEFYKTQMKYYHEIEEYIQKIKNENIEYNSKENEISYQVDKYINIINELINIINIIKNRASRNKLLLENDIEKITEIIIANDNVYNYIYNFSVNFKYFNINFYNYFDSKIPTLPIFNNIDNINNLIFDNFNNVSQELITYSHSVLNNSIPFLIKLSNLKTYFNFLNDFFDITKLKSLLTNFQDTTISNELVNTFQNINNKIDFIKLGEYSVEIIDHFDSFITIHENNINNLESIFLDFKNNFCSNFISTKILIEEYNSLLYHVIVYSIDVNIIQEIDISYFKNILLSKKIIPLPMLDKILSYTDSINQTYNMISILQEEEFSHEKLLIEKHNLFELYNNNLQQLLANQDSENITIIIQQNKDILTIEENIKEIVETIDNIKNKIYASENFISSEKKNILNEIYNIIKYYK